MASKLRIKILGVPSSLGANRFGAEGGYRAMCAARLHQELADLGHTVVDCGTMHITDGKDPGNPKALYLREIADMCARLAAWVEQALEEGFFPLVIGGDHSITIGSLAGVAAYHRKRAARLGLIWLDAHGDMNTAETTPSGNVHGMPLAISLGIGPDALRDVGGFTPKVAPENVALVGIRDIDPPEAHLIETSGIDWYTTRDIDERGMFAVMNDAITAATDDTAGFHVSLDMDALDPLIAPGVGTPVLGGLTYREAHLALEMIADSERMASLDIVEINPLLDERNQTAQAAVKLCASALGKRILPSLHRPVPMRP